MWSVLGFRGFSGFIGFGGGGGGLLGFMGFICGLQRLPACYRGSRVYLEGLGFRV